MKMRKIMAAGIAATMAVTSLAAVVSAETQTLTFNMGKTREEHKISDVVTHFFKDNTTIVASDGVFTNSEATLKVTDKKDGWTVDAVKLWIKGTKIGDTAASKNTYDFVGKDGVFTLLLTKENIVNAAGQVNMNVYEVITDAEIQVTYKRWANDYSTSQTYKKVKDNVLKSEITFDVVTGAEDDNLTKLAKYLKGSKLSDKEYESSSWTQDLYALLRQTAKDNQTLYRDNIRVLSQTDDYHSSSANGETDIGDQTYDGNGLGTEKNAFAGLASQVADFFNHKTNGTITFKFTTKAAADNGWLNGGVPATQIGIKNMLSANNFALYVNYKSSTGSLEATTSVDKASGTVTFDISEILADLGGQTMGVITDLYYGLNQGIYYGWPYEMYDGRAFDGTGLLVEEVTLAYEDDAADEDDVIDEEPVDEEPVDEEPVDEEPADEDVDVEVDEDPADDEDEDEDTDTDGDMVDDEPAADDEEDTNPGTGVALAVVPAIMAAAAVVVSKKRK